MSIEFECPSCQHRLRTPDSKAGMSARCPACGEKIWVPYPHQSTGDEAGAASEIPPLTGGPPPLPSLSGATGTSSHQSSEPQPEEFIDVEATTAKSVECPECGFENDPRETTCEECGALLRVNKRRKQSRAKSEVEPFEVGTILSDAWAVYTKHMAPLLFGPLLLGICIVPLFLLGFIPFFCLLPAAGAGGEPALGMIVFFGSIIVFGLLLVLVQSAASVGIHWTHFRTFEGETPTIGDHFFAFSGGWSIVTRMMGLLLLMGLILIPTCGLAGLVMWPIPALLVQRDLGPMEALSQGWGLIMEHFGTVLLVSLACFGIALVAGFVPFGQVFAAPYLSLVYSLGTLRLLGEPAVIPRK